MLKAVNFSLLRREPGIPNNPSLLQSSSLLFFDVSGIGFGFPIHVFIVNLVISALVFLAITFLLLEVNTVSPSQNATHPFPGKLYCHSFLVGSLLIESTAQLIHIGGSVLLIVGAVKRSKILCYIYIICSLLSFLVSTAIRTAQIFICEEKVYAEARPRPWGTKADLPEYYKLVLMWLVCQLFWYWLVFSFVTAQLEWFQTLQTEQGMLSRLPATTSVKMKSPERIIMADT